MVGEEIFTGLTFGLFASIIITLLAFIIAIYIYSALAWMTIAKKSRYKKAWLAWIPIADISMKLQMGGFHWAWVFLILIPIFGWIALLVLVIIATWRIFEKLKYPGWLALAPIIPYAGPMLYLISIGIVAWYKEK